MTNKNQALSFAGFEGCASSREFDWHLASDTEAQWDRFPDAQSYRWTVGKEDGCDGLLELDKEQMVRDLVEQGGWLFVGDSITEGHFFSLSCTLYPHVIATPTYTPGSYFDRAWPQNLYLNPESPLLRLSSPRRLRIPPWFNITSTPLATFRRIDLLFEQKDLEELHHKIHPATRSNFSLFSEEPTWSLSPKEYMTLFLNRSYSTMVVSTAGHWTTTLFGGYDPKEPAAFEGAKLGIDGVIDFFGHAMRQWADEVQGALRDAAKLDQGPRKRQAVIRAYLPGHEDCHTHRRPWTEVLPYSWEWYNWNRIWEFNEVFEVWPVSSVHFELYAESHHFLVKNIINGGADKYPDIHFLAIERPGRLRPDAVSLFNPFVSFIYYPLRSMQRATVCISWLVRES